MSPRLKDVINQLYRPVLQGGRQVFALSRAEAEQLPRLSNVAIISIISPGQAPAAFDGLEHLLRLEFEDVDFLNTELSAKAKEKLPGSFTDNQARLIRSFIENLPALVHTIVVHCGGGFSRSCAVAFCINRLYGYRVEADRLQQANPSVIQILLRASNEPKQTRSPRRSGRQ